MSQRDGAPASPGQPGPRTAYEAVLCVIGRRLDCEGWRWVTIEEQADQLVVRGLRAGEQATLRLSVPDLAREVTAAPERVEAKPLLAALDLSERYRVALAEALSLAERYRAELAAQAEARVVPPEVPPTRDAAASSPAAASEVAPPDMTTTAGGTPGPVRAPWWARRHG